MDPEGIRPGLPSVDPNNDALEEAKGHDRDAVHQVIDRFVNTRRFKDARLDDRRDYCKRRMEQELERRCV